MNSPLLFAREMLRQYNACPQFDTHVLPSMKKDDGAWSMPQVVGIARKGDWKLVYNSFHFLQSKEDRALLSEHARDRVVRHAEEFFSSNIPEIGMPGKDVGAYLSYEAFEDKARNEHYQLNILIKQTGKRYSSDVWEWPGAQGTKHCADIIEADLRKYNVSPDRAYKGRRDYRPWVRRMIEIYAGIPPAQWHDPKIYLQPLQIDPRVHSALGVLYSADEQEELCAIIKERMQSVPRMNLGIVRLGDGFAADAQFLMEYFSQLGVMEPVAAREDLSRRVANLMMGEFQTDPQVATQMLERLVKQ